MKIELFAPCWNPAVGSGYMFMMAIPFGDSMLDGIMLFAKAVRTNTLPAGFATVVCGSKMGIRFPLASRKFENSKSRKEASSAEEARPGISNRREMDLQ